MSDGYNWNIKTFEDEEFVDIIIYDNYGNIVKDFTDLYQISNYGRVWSVRAQMFLEYCPLRAYLTVALSKGGKEKKYYIHHLVLFAFDRYRKENEECRHLDRNPHNNHIDNLKWGTAKENAADRKLHGTSGKGEKNSQSKLIEDDVREIRKLFSTGNYSYEQIADMFNISRNHTVNIVMRQRWKHVI